MPTKRIESEHTGFDGHMLLDTHIAVWLAQDSSRFKSATLSLIEDSFHAGRMYMSAISAWEIGLLVSKNKLDLGQSPFVWFSEFVDKFNVTVVDVTVDVAIKGDDNDSCKIQPFAA